MTNLLKSYAETGDVANTQVGEDFLSPILNFQQKAKATWKTITFKTLWENYPSSTVEHLDKNNNDIYEHHCAIHLSESLFQSGIEFIGDCSKYSCPNGRSTHILLATSLSVKINVQTNGIKNILRKDLTGATYEAYVKDKTGIIYFENYWKRPQETDEKRSGDHIDLWNKNELASNGVLKTWLRQAFPSVAERLGSSDLTKSKNVIFWEIK